MVHFAGDGIASETHQATPEGVADFVHLHFRVLLIPTSAECLSLADTTSIGLPYWKAKSLDCEGPVAHETGGHGAVPDVVCGRCFVGYQEQDHYRDIPSGTLSFWHGLVVNYFITLVTYV